MWTTLRSWFVGAIAAAALLLLLGGTDHRNLFAGITVARADGPITRAQCFIINPNPTVTDCTGYLPPTVDVYNNLPYDSVAVYSDCVKARCVCTGAATSTAITTSGINCNSSGWEESGFTTCNVMNHCFVKFWQCLNAAIFERNLNHRSELDAAETTIINDIITHGSTPGEPFDATDVFRSCRSAMCAAVNSRQNCGLITCLPNYTQCDEYIRPPPLPYTHQLCTQSCRAALLMMAMTIAVVSLATCCCCCCPAQVQIQKPVVQAEAQGSEKVGAESNSNDNRREEERWAAQPTAT